MTKIVSEKVLMTKELSFVKRSIGRIFLSMLILFLSISNVAVPVYGETVVNPEITYTLDKKPTTYFNFWTIFECDDRDSPTRKFTPTFQIKIHSIPCYGTYIDTNSPLTGQIIYSSPTYNTNSGSFRYTVNERYKVTKWWRGVDTPATSTWNTFVIDWTRTIVDKPTHTYGFEDPRDPEGGRIFNTYSPKIIRYNFTVSLIGPDGSKIKIQDGSSWAAYATYVNNYRQGGNSGYSGYSCPYGWNCLTVFSDAAGTKQVGGSQAPIYGSEPSTVDNNWIAYCSLGVPPGNYVGDVGRINKHIYTQGVTATLPSTTIVQESGSTLYANPSVVEPVEDLVAKVEDSVDWTKDIKATWGYTTDNVIRPTSTATTDGGGDGMGTITDTTLSDGTDADLSTDGSTFDKIGVKEHEYLIKDAHSLSTDAQYSGDTTSATVNRNIIVKTDAAPTLNAYYAGTDNEYKGEWLSQYAPENPLEGPDAAHFKKVDLKANGSGIAGTYDTVIWEEGASEGSDSEAARGTNTNSATHTYGTETGAEGTSFYANLQEANNGTAAKTAGLTALSGNTESVTVKIDSTPPTANVSVNDDWHEGLTFADSSNDALSGIDKVYIALVAPDSTAPAIGDNSWQEPGSNGTVDYTPGEEYDIYAYAVDNATNKSPVKLLESGKETIRRHHTVSYESNGGSPVASEQVYEGEKATEPTAPTRTDYHFVGWYQEEGLTNPFNFDTPIMQETKLYAKWVDDKNGNSVDDNTEFRTINYTDGVDDEEVFADVEYNNALDGLSTPAFDPADPDKEPTRKYFVFDGWAPQVAGVVNGDATYTARWAADNNEDGVPDEKHPYTVTFDSDGKDWVNGPAPQTGILYGEKATRPSPDPNAANYVFDGWYKENTFNNAWDFDSDVVHHDLTIYAKWLDDFNNSGINDEDEYVIVKYVDGVDDEDLFEDQVYEKQLPGNAPPEFRGVPSRDYYLFGGWDPEVPSVIPDVPKDTVITYTATWKEDRNDNGIADEDEPYEYFYSEGDGNVWQKGSGVSSDFIVKRSLFDEDAFEHFTNGGHGIQVDGATVDVSNYTATEGSVKLSLKPAYLETLAVGEHKLTTLFDDGEATASFYVRAQNADLGGPGSGDDSGTVPSSSGEGNSSNGQDDAKGGKTARGSSARTGDESLLYGWLTAMLIASIAAAGILYRRRSKS